VKVLFYREKKEKTQYRGGNDDFQKETKQDGKDKYNERIIKEEKISKWNNE